MKKNLMHEPSASRTARALARLHALDLHALSKGVAYVITLQDVLRCLDGRGPTRHTLRKRAPIFVPFAPKVRPYQWECVRQVHDQSGFVIAPCGCGKTLIGLLVAVLNGGRFLVLTTRYAEQWKRTLDEFFAPVDAHVQVVVGHPDAGVIPDVLISTYSAFCPYNERLRLAKHVVYDTIVLDEAHAAASTANLALLDRLHTSRWCALTATLVREDQELTKLEARVGGVVVEVDRHRLIREGFVPEVKILNLVVPYDDAHAMERHIGRHNALALHPNKVQVLLCILRMLIADSQKIIIFCDDLFCLQWTSDIIRASRFPYVGSISMSTTMETRRAILDAFENHADATIVTVSRTGDEALDLPSASAGIVFWNHWASRRQIVQRVGRLSRMRDGKAPIFITLLADDPKEHQVSKHRESYMRAHGFTIQTQTLAASSYATPLHSADAYLAKLKARYNKHHQE